MGNNFHLLIMLKSFLMTTLKQKKVIEVLKLNILALFMNKHLLINARKTVLEIILAIKPEFISKTLLMIKVICFLFFRKNNRDLKKKKNCLKMEALILKYLLRSLLIKQLRNISNSTMI
jgi:hypothetical protein